jgi:hypothetical protein
VQGRGNIGKLVMLERQGKVVPIASLIREGTTVVGFWNLFSCRLLCSTDSLYEASDEKETIVLLETKLLFHNIQPVLNMNELDETVPLSYLCYYRLSENISRKDCKHGLILTQILYLWRRVVGVPTINLRSIVFFHDW